MTRASEGESMRNIDVGEMSEKKKRRRRDRLPPPPTNDNATRRQEEEEEEEALTRTPLIRAMPTF